MSSVAVVLPTVTGRESAYDQTLAALEEHWPASWQDPQIVVPVDYATVGAAWNAGRRDVDAEYLWFMIDDAVPHAGAVEAAVEAADAGYAPSGRHYLLDGSIEQTGSMGCGALLKHAADWTPCRSAPVPFVRSEWYDAVGGFLPIHMYADDAFAWRLCCHGVSTVYREPYTFTHLHHPVAHQPLVRLAGEHCQAFLRDAEQQTARVEQW